ncbi:MAG: hypothetical protein ACK4VV_06150 [Pseudomonas sp.]
MQVPAFWAEATSSAQIKGKARQIRRFGWSDASQQQAQQHAQTRLTEAVSALQAGERIKPRDPRSGYNGAEGLPIREEIIGRHQNAVITRNSYGALCLNTPDVLFADIDIKPTGGGLRTLVGLLVLAPFCVLLSWLLPWTILVSIPAALFLSGPLAGRLFPRWLNPQRRGQIEALGRVKAFSAKHPDWHLHLYQTPAGLRVLVLHKLFDPRSAEVSDFFAAVAADPVYQQMCRNQNCFRARLSPKPWRIGMQQQLSPAARIWPVTGLSLNERLSWIRSYESKSRDYAACHYLKALGSGRVNAQAGYIKALHDQYCKASSTLPIA